MTQEAKVRLRLDTRDADAKLERTVKKGKRTAGEVSGLMRRTIGKGLGYTGAGAAFGTGLAAVRGDAQSGLGSILGETFGGVGASLSESLFGDLDDKAAAAKRAREETIAAFSTIAGETGRVPPEARSFFTQVRALRETEERGRQMIERDDAFRGPGVQALLDRLITGIGEYITSGFSALGDMIGLGGR